MEPYKPFLTRQRAVSLVSLVCKQPRVGISPSVATGRARCCQVDNREMFWRAWERWGWEAVILLPDHGFRPPQGPSCLCTHLGHSQGWVAPGSAPSVGQQDTPQLRVEVKAACRQASTLPWPRLLSLHPSLPHPPIKLHFQPLLCLGVSVLHAQMEESWVPALKEGNPGSWGGPKSRLDAGGIGREAWDSRGSCRAEQVAEARYYRCACCMYVDIMYFPLPGCHLSSWEWNRIRILSGALGHRM